MNTTKGKLIVIDGTDGTGKKTQTRLLVEKLQKEGHVVHSLDFPGYTRNVAGKLIHEALKEGKYGDFLSLPPKIVSVLYAFDRMEDAPRIQGWLDTGDIVVLDRYVSSNQIHQGGKIADDNERKEFIKWLYTLEFGAAKLPRPDLVLYLLVPIEVSLELIKARSERTGEAIDQSESSEQHLRESQERTLSIISDYPEWQVVDCSTPDLKEIKKPEEIAPLVYEVVLKHL
jgi:dTMP kinase